jgi:hypothetical protein
MTEEEWFVCADPQMLLHFLLGRASDRKFRLFACACCRDFFWTSLRKESSREAIRCAERFADGLIGAESLGLSGQAVYDAPPQLSVSSEYFKVMQIAVGTTYTHWQPTQLASFTATAVCDLGDRRIRRGEEQCKYTRNRLKVSDLFRHIIGNPFRPYTAPAAWPSTVIDLAQSLYDGNDNRLILADALEEAGHLELAEHFRKEEWHPKGCWVVDMILGKS